MATADATKLVSINDMLSDVGAVRTNSLSATRPDVLLALQHLDKVDRSVQLSGRSWNTEYNQTFQPNVSDNIVLTDDIFEVRESSGQDDPRTTYRDSRLDYHKRGNRLYDALADSYTFEADVLLNVVRRVDFDQMPQSAREFITARATVKFFRALRGGQAIPNDLLEQELRARVAFDSAELRNTDANFFRGPDTSWTRTYRQS